MDNTPACWHAMHSSLRHPFGGGNTRTPLMPNIEQTQHPVSCIKRNVHEEVLGSAMLVLHGRAGVDMLSGRRNNTIFVPPFRVNEKSGSFLSHPSPRVLSDAREQQVHERKEATSGKGYASSSRREISGPSMYISTPWLRGTTEPRRPWSERSNVPIGAFGA